METSPQTAPAPHPGWRRPAAISAAIVLVLGGIATFALRPRQKPGPTFETAKITRGPLQARITASGTLAPLTSVQVGSQISGRIQELRADFNSLVTRGQVIARIDPQLYVAAREKAAANLQAARGNVTKAAAELEEARRQQVRNQRLVEKKLIAQSEADTTETALRVARASLVAARAAQAQAEAELKQAEVNVAYTTIVSPIDGVVISRNVDVGQTVAASLQSPTLFVIAQDLTRMEVDTSVAEADVGRLQAGMTATFIVDAWPNEPFGGKIREIRNAAQTVQNVVTYVAVIDVDNPDLKLKPGMTANVTVVYADREDVLKLPNAALRFRPAQDATGARRATPAPKGDQRTVWLPKDGEPAPVEIRIGVSDGTFTELAAGPLKEGDLVITEAVGAPRSGPGSFGRVF